MVETIVNEVKAPIFIKDVRRNKDTRDWSAFVTVDGNEIYLGSCQWSWDAESLCDQYVHEHLMRLPLVADNFPAELVSCVELEHEAMIGADTVFVYEGISVTVERNHYPATNILDACVMTRYEAGKASVLYSDSIDTPDEATWLECGNTNDITAEQMRNLYAVLSHPDVQARIGFKSSESKVTITREYDEREGLDFTSYRCDGVAIHRDGFTNFDVSDLIDTHHYSQPSDSGNYTLKGYTDLAGLQRIHTALGAIINRIQQPEQVAPSLKKAA